MPRAIGTPMCRRAIEDCARKVLIRLVRIRRSMLFMNGLAQGTERSSSERGDVCRDFVFVYIGMRLCIG
jgi:hypothetical protein